MFCTEAIIQEETKFIVKASQQEDYVFQFFKGIDSIGTALYEEVIVPVN